MVSACCTDDVPESARNIDSRSNVRNRMLATKTKMSTLVCRERRKTAREKVTSSSLVTKHLPEFYSNFEVLHTIKNGRPGRYLISLRKTKTQQKRDPPAASRKKQNTTRGNSEEHDSNGRKQSEMPKSQSYARKPRNCNVCFIWCAGSRQ